MRNKYFVMNKENSNDSGRIVSLTHCKVGKSCCLHFLFSKEGEFLRTSPLKKVEEYPSGKVVLTTQNSIYKLSPFQISWLFTD